MVIFSDTEPTYPSSSIDRARLPTAPKASRGADVDMARIPTDPPYVAFIGNLPYEVSPEKIETFFSSLPVRTLFLSRRSVVGLI